MTMEVACRSCGEFFIAGENHHCETKSPMDIMERIPWWVKGGVIAGVGWMAIGSLPAQVTTLAMSGLLIGSMWVVMVLMPLGDGEKDWLARHPRTFMLLHVPTTGLISMLGEGIIMAFGNLLGGVLATVWLMGWGHKRGISLNGKKTAKYKEPEPTMNTVRIEKAKARFWRGVVWTFS